MAEVQSLPKKAVICEVGPRDGLQSEKDFFPTDKKIEFILRMAKAGLPEIEATSFVSPKWVPQMRDAEDVVRTVSAEVPPTTTLAALIPNERGYDRAAQTGLKKLRLVVAASETFHRRNFNQSIDETLTEYARVFSRARGEGIACVGVIGSSWGCPLEGRVPAEQSLRIAKKMADAGAAEVFFADTTGMASPRAVFDLLSSARENLDIPIGTHFHNTRSTGYANVYAALEAGIDRFDSSLGGLGGCPFAPLATGNIATEDTVHMLELMGIATGINLEALISDVKWIETNMDRRLPGQLAKAGPAFQN